MNCCPISIYKLSDFNGKDRFNNFFSLYFSIQSSSTNSSAFTKDFSNENFSKLKREENTIYDNDENWGNLILLSF